MNSLIAAKLVFDQGDLVLMPSEMGTPREDQLQGTPAERLVEIAGRVCYDSLGKGRPSFSRTAEEESPFDGANITRDLQGYHDHIRQVGHGSVWEHFNFTVEIPLGKSKTLSNDRWPVQNRRALFGSCCTNRPGVMSFFAFKPKGIRVTLNLRSVVEWLRWEQELYNGRVTPCAMQFASMFHRIGHELAPHIISESPQFDGEIVGVKDSASLVEFDELQLAELSRPISDHERWISMYLTGSRGLSHELVRHGDFTAISQRSTRFVDESESPWVEHPLTSEFRAMAGSSPDPQWIVAESHAKETYRATAASLEPWLIARGVEKTSARKQARGAARGYLGNALHTELIFSANVAQWKRMLRQRASQFADAEIRELFCKVLAELKTSRYADRFDGWELVPSPDGIGQVAVEGAATA